MCAGIYRKRPLPHVVSDDDIELVNMNICYALSVFALYQYATRVHCIVFAPCKTLCKKQYRIDMFGSVAVVISHLIVSSLLSNKKTIYFTTVYTSYIIPVVGFKPVECELKISYRTKYLYGIIMFILCFFAGIILRRRLTFCILYLNREQL